MSTFWFISHCAMPVSTRSATVSWPALRLSSGGAAGSAAAVLAAGAAGFFDLAACAWADAEDANSADRAARRMAAVNGRDIGRLLVLLEREGWRARPFASPPVSLVGLRRDALLVGLAVVDHAVMFLLVHQHRLLRDLQ